VFLKEFTTVNNNGGHRYKCTWMHHIVLGKIFFLFCCVGYTVHAGANTNLQHYGAAVSTFVSNGGTVTAGLTWPLRVPFAPVGAARSDKRVLRTEGVPCTVV